MNFSAPIVGAVIGAVVLFFGRKLFWLCVAAVGFAAGVELAPHVVSQPTPLLALSFALVFGFLGALLAVFLQKISVAVVGFLAGGKLANAIAGTFFVHYVQHTGIIFLVGGIIGLVLLLSLFDWALIFASAVVGAHLIQGVVTLPPTGAAILFVLLTITGVLVQAAALRSSRVTAPAS